jgi:large subunit ribosomal protein L22
MASYSFNLDKSDVVFASASDLNASFKDLCAVCDAIRYRSYDEAMRILDSTASGATPIKYNRWNRYMGSRHELGGKTGRYPKKCAAIVRKVMANAYANAKNKGYEPSLMHVVHASANKTLTAPRSPPKGARAVTVGGYGYTSMRKSNLEFSRVEIGLSSKYEGKLGKRTTKIVKLFSMIEKKNNAKGVAAKTAAKPAAKPAVKVEKQTAEKQAVKKMEPAKVEAVKS